MAKKIAARNPDGSRKYPTYQELTVRCQLYEQKLRYLKEASVHAKLLKQQPGKVSEGNNYLVLAVEAVLR